MLPFANTSKLMTTMAAGTVTMVTPHPTLVGNDRRSDGILSRSSARFSL